MLFLGLEWWLVINWFGFWGLGLEVCYEVVVEYSVVNWFFYIVFGSFGSVCYFEFGFLGVCFRFVFYFGFCCLGCFFRWGGLFEKWIY